MGGELNIKRLAERLQVGVRDMAHAAGIGVSTLHLGITTDRWPKRLMVDRDSILALLRKRGATDDELSTAFDRVPPKPPKPTKAPAIRTTRPQPAEHQETEMLMGKQTLSMAARKAFGLFQNPFDGEVSSEAEMFVSGEIRFVREACWQAAVNGSFVAILGESGAGKTTILADLKDRLQTSTPQPVITIEPSVLGMGHTDTLAKVLKSGDILTACVASLDPSAPIKQTIESRTRQLVKLLDDSVKAGNAHLLIIEEAHDMPKQTLKHLKRLHERTRIGRRPALGILLLAQPELRQILNERAHDVREVYQRLEMIDLMPLGSDLRPYLEHKAKLAGRSLIDLITDDGVDELRARLTVERRSNGGQSIKHISLLYPLAVNNVMTAALNLAADLGAPVIDRDVMRSVR
jgi:type II secretory pathway predicted ATPase ExeA